MINNFYIRCVYVNSKPIVITGAMVSLNYLVILKYILNKFLKESVIKLWLWW